MTCELSRELTRQYYNSMLKDKFNRDFDLDIYTPYEYNVLSARLLSRQKHPEAKPRVKRTDEEKIAYQKEYQKQYREKHKYHYKQHHKEYYERNRERILQQRATRTKTYKLKLELANCPPLDDNFDNIDMIIDF